MRIKIDNCFECPGLVSSRMDSIDVFQCNVTGMRVFNLLEISPDCKYRVPTAKKRNGAGTASNNARDEICRCRFGSILVQLNNTGTISKLNYCSMCGGKLSPVA